MQAPSGQLVHHLQRGTDAWWGKTDPMRSSGSPASLLTQILPPNHSRRAWWFLSPSTLPHTTHLSISRLQGPGMAGKALTAGPETSAFLRGMRHWGASRCPTAQPGETPGLGSSHQPGLVPPPPIPASRPSCMPTALSTTLNPAPSPSHLPIVPCPPVTQASDTKQHVTSSCPSSTKAFSLLNFSDHPLLPTSADLCSDLFLLPRPPVSFLPAASPGHSLPHNSPNLAFCPGLPLPPPAQTFVAPCHSQWRSITFYPKSLKAHVLQNFPDFRKAVDVCILT